MNTESSNPGEYYSGSLQAAPPTQHTPNNSFYDYSYGPPPPNTGPPAAHPNSMDVPLTSSLLNGLGDPQAPNAPQPVYASTGSTADQLASAGADFML
jgi:hypothetical protein